MQISVRPMRAGDRDDVAVVLMHAGDAFCPCVAKAGDFAIVLDIMEAMKQAPVVAVDVETQRVVAVAIVCSTIGFDGTVVCEFKAVTVAADVRRRGVGTLFVRTLVARSFEPSVRFLCVHVAGAEAAAFFRQIGFAAAATADPHHQQPPPHGELRLHRPTDPLNSRS